MIRLISALFCTLCALSVSGCYSTTVLRPAAWPQGVELLAAPPAAPPLAMVEATGGGIFGSPGACREALTAKAKELGAVAIYMPSETSGACRAFAYAK